MQTYNGSDLDINKTFDIVHIPSKGRFYKNKKPYLMVKYLTFAEEKLLANEGIMNTAEGVKMVLQSVIVGETDVNELLPGDVQAISMFLFSTSFGDIMEIDVHCPICSHEEKRGVKISGMKMKEVIHEINEDRTLETTLPQSKKKIKIKIPTYLEEFELRKEIPDGRAHTGKLVGLIESIDGVEDRNEVYSILCSVPIRDSRDRKSVV
jgi:hypothetical protein